MKINVVSEGETKRTMTTHNNNNSKESSEFSLTLTQEHKNGQKSKTSKISKLNSFNDTMAFRTTKAYTEWLQTKNSIKPNNSRKAAKNSHQPLKSKLIPKLQSSLFTQSTRQYPSLQKRTYTSRSTVSNRVLKNKPSNKKAKYVENYSNEALFPTFSSIKRKLEHPEFDFMTKFTQLPDYKVIDTNSSVLSDSNN